MVCRDLVGLSLSEIPRSYFEYASDKVSKSQIVAFSDASEKAYCVIVYLQYRDLSGKIQCLFIFSKTRVAPLKTLTLPRLELKAASLLVEIVSKVAAILSIDLDNIYAFTDSSVVLYLLSQPASTFKVFVSNRIEKIVKVIQFSRWHYANSAHNPADYDTRGLSAETFIKNKSCWFYGPEFLYQDNAFTFFTIPNLDVQNFLERRKIKAFVFNVVNTPSLLIDKISSYPRLINITAYVLRFIKCWSTKKVSRHTSLSFEETEHAYRTMIKITQFVTYSLEIKALRDDVRYR